MVYTFLGTMYKLYVEVHKMLCRMPLLYKNTIRYAQSIVSKTRPLMPVLPII